MIWRRCKKRKSPTTSGDEEHLLESGERSETDESSNEEFESQCETGVCETDVGSHTDSLTSSSSLSQNCLNVFGSCHEQNFSLNSNTLEVKMRNSQVMMTIPLRAVKHQPIKVYCTSYSNIPEIYSKFNIDKDMRVCSPVVEYSFSDETHFLEHACVELPFFGDMESLQVWKFTSEVERTPKLKEVPVRDKFNKSDDVYYIVVGSCHTFLHFSIENSNFSLTVQIFEIKINFDFLSFRF